ncbi:MAG: hypothetical protein ABI990_12485 [Actinomycetota bacterium]
MDDDEADRALGPLRVLEIRLRRKLTLGRRSSRSPRESKRGKQRNDDSRSDPHAEKTPENRAPL